MGHLRRTQAHDAHAGRNPYAGLPRSVNAHHVALLVQPFAEVACHVARHAGRTRASRTRDATHGRVHVGGRRLPARTPDQGHMDSWIGTLRPSADLARHCSSRSTSPTGRTQSRESSLSSSSGCRVAFALPAYLEDIADVFRVDADGVRDVKWSKEGNSVRISDMARLVGVYVATLRPTSVRIWRRSARNSSPRSWRSSSTRRPTMRTSDA